MIDGWQGKHGPYLIAEIGGNHEGDFEYAKELTYLACTSGADAVKFQIYTGESLVSKLESPDRCSHFERFQFTPEQYINLAEICKKEGVVFTASVWDSSAFDWIDPYMKFYKIGSGDLTAYPIIKKITSLKKPIILSTGLSTFNEVRTTVEFIQSQNSMYLEPENLALLQCTSMYPIPDEDANLQVMNLFRREFNLTIGYSDHTVGNDAVEIAVAMGAGIIEFHFTDSREGKIFRDHQVSFTCDEIKRLIHRITKIKTLQGQMIKEPTISEIEANHVLTFRRAVYPLTDLTEGQIIKEKNLTILRPNLGVDARKYETLIGKKTKKKIPAFSQIKILDVE